MNLEEIKEDRKYCYAGVEYEQEELVDWLISEVERLTMYEETLGKTLIEWQKEIATRCAEICDTQPPDAATLIKKEYGLE